MFQLDQHDAVFSHLNLRKEKHGDEDAAAADLKFSLNAPNTILNTIDPAILPAFWKKADKGQQQNLPMEGSTDLVALNLPLLGEQDITGKFEGYELSIGSLMDHIEPVFFADTKVKKITWKPLEGGSVAMGFTCSVLLDEDEAAELLSAWIRGEVRLTLTPPSAAAQQEDLAA
ncbi:TPA: hypothetical protein QDZ57_000200 [Stenotrophomonas maltophilia]|nr:hypothetical protein [Stenotrophomonas maltophilia]